MRGPNTTRLKPYSKPNTGPMTLRVLNAHAYEMPWDEIDERVDRKIDTVVKGLPDKLIPEIRNLARSIYAEGKVTELRAKELAISQVYQKPHYQPSWNSYVRPETQFDI